MLSIDLKDLGAIVSSDGLGSDGNFQISHVAIRRPINKSFLD